MTNFPIKIIYALNLLIHCILVLYFIILKKTTKFSEKTYENFLNTITLYKRVINLKYNLASLNFLCNNKYLPIE